MFEQMGVSTGVDLDAAAETGVFLAEVLGRPLAGRYHRYHLGATTRLVEKAARDAAKAAQVTA